MDRHCDNAEKIYEKLSKHPKVKTVYYPFDPNHPDYKIAQKQMRRGGGMISFEIEGSKRDAHTLLNTLSFIKLAVRLGDAKTLLQHPATMTHTLVSEAERFMTGITDKIIRLS